MIGLKRIFKRWWSRVFPGRPSRPADIPQKLSQDALRRAMDEARLLRSAHAVEVQPLASGELPGLPKKISE